MTKILLISIMLSTLTACGFEVVDTGNRGIRVTMGEVIGEPLPEGFYTYNPFTSDIVEYNTREDKFTDKTIAFTKDTQQVTIEFTAVWYPDPKHVDTLYKEVGKTAAVEEKILKPAVLGSLKDAVGTLVADELVGKREAATKMALVAVQGALAKRHIIVTDLQFTNLDFDDTYEKAVEEKAVASQLAQKAINDTKRIQEESKQTVATAQGAAEAMRIKSQALAQNRGLIEYELAQRWNGALPQFMMGGSGSVPMIDISKLIKKDK